MFIKINPDEKKINIFKAIKEKYTRNKKSTKNL